MMIDLCLQYLECEPRTKTEKTPIVLFLHGRGANELDLFDLSQEIDTHFRVLSLRAPVQVGQEQFAWFETSFAEAKNRSIYDRMQVEKSQKLLLEFIKQVKHKYAVAAHQIFLLGFSQGSMMSLGIALEYPDLIGGVAALGGCILPEFLLRITPEKYKNFPILLSHGSEDTVIPIQYARESKDVLSKLPIALSYYEYPMGHDVTEMNFLDVKKWLFNRIGIIVRNEKNNAF